MAETNGVSASVQDSADHVVTEVKLVTDPTQDLPKGNAKSDTGLNGSTGLASGLEKQVIRQIEYYFGDINLPRDKFLLEQVKLDDGWVPLDVMFKFKRLASLSTDPDVVIGALTKSTEKLMEISEDRKKIRRCPSKPLPILNEERKKELSSRTLYIKGFPLKGVTLDDVLEYFAPYGPVENITMRSFKDKATNQMVFKGSVFALFKTIEGAKTFMELDSVKYGDVELIRKWQIDYLEGKRKEREEKKTKGKSETSSGSAPEKELPKGCVLHFKGLSEGNEITREQIKAQLVELGAEVAYIDFSKGDEELWVRLHVENSAKNILAEHMPEGTYKLCECDVEVRMLEGEEEDNFLTKSKQDMLAIAQRNYGRGRGNQRGRGKGNRGRGGRGAQKRKGSPHADPDSSSKKQAA